MRGIWKNRARSPPLQLRQRLLHRRLGRPAPLGDGHRGQLQHPLGLMPFRKSGGDVAAEDEEQVV